MAESVKLKLVGAERYISPMTNNDVIEKGQMVDVSPEHAKVMLAETKMDALNNEHPVWKEATEEDLKPKSARVARTAKGKKADADESGEENQE